ncbi:MAG: DUF935 family protein [Holophagales bacterium]|nr:DUF935 family protein [Holophagales bacterium]MYD23455.1 DUF935 family protein [Holophagales bacterium]MYI34478.1 DUF935 family protein [Holophagales bacterium]
MAARTPRGDVARVTGTRDVTRGWVDGLWYLQPQDGVLTSRGGGDYELYEELLRDDRVKSSFQQRFSALIDREIEVLPGRRPGQKRADGSNVPADDQAAADHLEDVLHSLDWDTLTEQMLYGVHYGYSVAEVIWGRDGQYVVPEKILPRNRRRFRWRVSKTMRRRYELLLITQEQPQGEMMPDRKFWTFRTGADNADEPYGRGLAHQLYWPVFLKRNQAQFWLIALEKFGMPIAVGKHLPGASEQDKAKLLEACLALRTETGVVIPDGNLIELLERKATGTMSYEEFYARMDRAIAEVILSETMTLEDGSSLSQAQVHHEVKKEVIGADAWVISESFTRTVATWLTEWNFPGAAVPRVNRVMEDPPDLEALAKRDKLIVEFTGRRLTEEYVKETYGVELGEETMPQMMPQGGPGGRFGGEDEGDEANMAGWQNRALSRPGAPRAAVLAEGRPRPDQIEQVLAAVDDGAWDLLAEDLIRPVLDLAQSDPAGMIRDLAAVYPGMETRQLTERLARLLFAADALGRLEIQEKEP